MRTRIPSGTPNLAMNLSSSAPRPNILLVTADDIGWQTVGCYDCPVPDTTPNIDAFAQTALRFERAHGAQAVCVPSRTAMQTGRTKSFTMSRPIPTRSTT